MFVVRRVCFYCNGFVTRPTGLPFSTSVNVGAVRRWPSSRPVPGLGPGRKAACFETSARSERQGADLDSLQEVSGIGPALATVIRDTLAGAVRQRANRHRNRRDRERQIPKRQRVRAQ